MRTAITIAIPHDGPIVFLSGPDVPIDAQKMEIKKFKALREHPDYAEVQFWDSHAGITSRAKLDKPKPAEPSEPPVEEPPAPPAETKRKK